MDLQQIPVPPVPTEPGSNLTLGGTLNDAAAVIMLLALLGTVILIFWPLARALARRLERGGGGAELPREVDALRQRVEQLEQGQARMAELEERVDFAERLLAQSREPDRLQR